MELSRRDVILASVAVFIAWGYATHWLPSVRFLPYAFVLGIVATIAFQAYIILSSSRPERSRQYGEGYPSRNVAFIQPRHWGKEKQRLQKRSQYISEPLYMESPVVTQSIDKLIGLILRDFVNSWYSTISKRPTFTNEVDKAIRAALSNILDRVIELDIVGIMVSRALPLITVHMREFDEAEKVVRGRKLSKNLTESEELDLAIASKYKDGKLHAAASLAFLDTKMAQQGHLRSVVVRLLPQVMPQEMMTSRAVTVLTQELVACAVLTPVIQLLADPDTWNQLIANSGRSILQERKSVKKLRAALEEHSQTSPRSVRSAPFPRLAPGDNERRFERFIRAIRKCNTLSDARRFRSEVASQLHKDSAVEGQDPIYLRRLETGKRALDQRISQLGADRSLNAPRSRLPPSEDSKRSTASRLESMSLREILYSASGLSYFMEYMDRVHLMKLVQFWIVVDGSRNPLEDETDDVGKQNDEVRIWTDADRADIAQINEAYLSQPEIKISPLAREAIRTFLKAGQHATNSQFYAARTAILRAQKAVYEDMQDPHFVNFKKSDLWFKLLAAEEAATSTAKPTVAQSSLLGSTSPDNNRPVRPVRLQTGPAKPKPPDLRRQVASAQDLKGFMKSAESDGESAGRRSLDNGRKPLFDDEVDSDALANSIASLDSDHEVATPINEDDPQVIDAMQEALNDIIDEPQDKESIFSGNSVKSPHDGDSTRSSLELARPGSPAVGLIRKGKPSAASLGLFGTPGRRGVFDEDLFESEKPKFVEDEREDSAGSDKDDDDAIVEAAPGDLGLAEAIDALTLDIEKLVTQESIVDSLTKKAELTNNAAELRILRKSKASLQREINRKELQRQQFIVQESDNSLYGRASIAIQSVMVGKDEEGKDYAVYVIEVRRQAGDQMPAALWIVSRRYSEFHALNKQLRSRFPTMRSLDFPRRHVGLKLQRDFLQKRKIALERYLQELLKIPAVCRSRELRAFLSAQALPSVNPGFTQVDQKDFVSRIYSSVTDGLDEFVGNIPVLDQLSLAGQNLISAATTQLNAAQAPTASATNGLAKEELAQSAEAEAELRAFEAKELEPFVKPICDLFLEVFELNRENNWLRGRAVVIVLQQLLGGTVERKIRDNARSYLSDEGMAKYINLVIDSMWPGGVRKTDSAPRTAQEKTRSKQEAGLVLASLVPEFVGSVVGRSNAQVAARRILAVVNNQRLLTHLVFTLLDEIVQIVFQDRSVR